MCVQDHHIQVVILGTQHLAMVLALCQNTPNLISVHLDVHHHMHLLE